MWSVLALPGPGQQQPPVQLSGALGAALLPPVVASQEQLVKQRLHVVVVELDYGLVAIAELAPGALVVIDTVLQAVDAAARRQYQ